MIYGSIIPLLFYPLFYIILLMTIPLLSYVSYQYSHIYPILAFLVSSKPSMTFILLEHYIITSLHPSRLDILSLSHSILPLPSGNLTV